jgi:hypothetical protein
MIRLALLAILFLSIPRPLFWKHLPAGNYEYLRDDRVCGGIEPVYDDPDYNWEAYTLRSGGADTVGTLKTSSFSRAKTFVEKQCPYHATMY